MAFKIQIRNFEKWEKDIIKGHIEIPKECENNALIFSWILNEYAPKVVPNLKNLYSEEIQTIAKSIAYMVRSDLLKSNIQEIFLPPFQIKIPKEKYFVNIELLNNPEKLYEGWRAFWHGKFGQEENTYAHRAAELFRCYWGTIYKMPNLEGRLYIKNKCFGCASDLADVTAYLVNPENLTDYEYTSKEKNKFNKKLVKQLSYEV